jgi:hypothetical protein
MDGGRRAKPADGLGAERRHRLGHPHGLRRTSEANHSPRNAPRRSTRGLCDSLDEKRALRRALCSRPLSNLGRQPRNSGWYGARHLDVGPPVLSPAFPLRTTAPTPPWHPRSPPPSRPSSSDWPERSFDQPVRAETGSRRGTQGSTAARRPTRAAPRSSPAQAPSSLRTEVSAAHLRTWNRWVLPAEDTLREAF